MRYRSVPTEVEAVQWFPGNAVPGVKRSLGLADRGFGDGRYYVVTIHEQTAYLEPGDYVITEPDGLHHYPCKPDIFAKKYRPVEAANRIESALADLRKNAMSDEEVEELLK